MCIQVYHARQQQAQLERKQQENHLLLRQTQLEHHITHLLLTCGIEIHQATHARDHIHDLTPNNDSPSGSPSVPSSLSDPSPPSRVPTVAPAVDSAELANRWIDFTMRMVSLGYSVKVVHETLNRLLKDSPPLGHLG